MQALFGINVETTAVEILNLNGFYPVEPSAPDFDLKLYDTVSSWSIVPIAGGEGAQLSWTPVAKPLPEAKTNGSIEAKQQADAATANTLTANYLSSDVLASVASQDPVDRPAQLQAVLDETVAISDALGANLTAIDDATNVDTIDSILRHSSGTFVSGRGGAGPLDMQPSYFTVLDNLPPGIGEPELEIYIPGTDTVIPYDGGLPEPYKFDSAGNCYNSGDYRTVIRVAATGQVLTTVYPAEGPAVPIEWTYNPTIPSYGGGGGSSHSAY